ncbi:MAG: TIGR02647 family protein [Saccharospirillum sp.]
MAFSVDHLAELNLLNQFPLTSQQAGLKVHRHEADPAVVAAAERLFDKGLISQRDGGYLTPLGLEAVELTQKLRGILS